MGIVRASDDSCNNASVCRHLKIAGRIAFFTISSGYQPPLAEVATQPLKVVLLGVRIDGTVKMEIQDKILAGSWVLARADKDPDAARRLRQDLDGFPTRPQDRALFDLAPRQKDA